MNSSEALLSIQELMDGVEWSPSTLDEIADIMRLAGYRVRDIDDTTAEPIPPHQFEIGQLVRWRGAWGSQPPQPVIITGIATKNDRTVYDLDNGHWAYEDQLSH